MKKNIIILFILFCLVGLAYSIFNILLWKKDINVNQTIKEETKINIIINNDELNDNNNLKNLNELKEKNHDTISYLVVNGTNIDYVVVKSNNNDYYLNHNFNNKKNSAGWIFMDYRNNFDGSDKNIIIYGHNMKDGSMFGTLKSVLNKSWQINKENLIIQMLTNEGIKMYQVFSTYKIEAEDYYLKTEFINDENYYEFLNKLKRRSNYNYEVDLNSDDRILTLSTCSNNGQKRVVLHAKLIN